MHMAWHDGVKWNTPTGHGSRCIHVTRRAVYLPLPSCQASSRVSKQAWDAHIGALHILTSSVSS